MYIVNWWMWNIQCSKVLIGSGWSTWMEKSKCSTAMLKENFQSENWMSVCIISFFWKRLKTIIVSFFCFTVSSAFGIFTFSVVDLFFETDIQRGKTILIIIVKIEGGLYLIIRQKKKFVVYQYKDLVYDHIIFADGLFLTQ